MSSAHPNAPPGVIPRRPGPGRVRWVPGRWRCVLLWALLCGSAAAVGQAGGTGALPSPLPPGAIIAFLPRFGDAYRNAEELDAWLAAQGFAICDGRQGTPDLRERMLLGSGQPERVGETLGSRDHDHGVLGETDTPVRRNRATPTGHEQLVQLPDDQHRHRIDLRTSRADHLPPSMRVLFIMKLPEPAGRPPAQRPPPDRP